MEPEVKPQSPTNDLVQYRSTFLMMAFLLPTFAWFMARANNNPLGRYNDPMARWFVILPLHGIALYALYRGRPGKLTFALGVAVLVANLMLIHRQLFSA
jgi:hypothetical protein